MDAERLQLYLAYIVSETEMVRSMTDGFDAERFASDPVVRRAVERSLETIGEAVSK